MNNSLNKENDQFLETIKSTIGNDIIETKAFFNDYQIIVPSKKIFDVLTKLHGNSYFAFDRLWCGHFYGMAETTLHHCLGARGTSHCAHQASASYDY